MSINVSDPGAFIIELATHTEPPNGDSKQNNLDPTIAAAADDGEHWVHWDALLGTDDTEATKLGVRLSKGQAKAILAVGDTLITLNNQNLVTFTAGLATLLSIAGDEVGAMPGVDDIDAGSVEPTVVTTTDDGSDAVVLFYVDDRDPDNVIIRDIDPAHRKYGLMDENGTSFVFNPQAARALWYAAASAANLSLQLAKVVAGAMPEQELFEIFDYLKPDND